MFGRSKPFGAQYPARPRRKKSLPWPFWPGEVPRQWRRPRAAPQDLGQAPAWIRITWCSQNGKSGAFLSVKCIMMILNLLEV